LSAPPKREAVIAELGNSFLKAIQQVEIQKKIQVHLEEITEGCSDTIMKNFIQRDSRKESKWGKITLSIIKTTYDGAKWVRTWGVIKNSDVDNRP